MAGGCLQRDTSAAAAALALSCQCLWFYGTFITICHSFNGVACMSCHLPLPPCAPPAHTYTNTHTLGSSAIWHRVIPIFWVCPGGQWGQELGRVAQVAQSFGSRNRANMGTVVCLHCHPRGCVCHPNVGCWAEVDVWLSLLQGKVA